MFHACVPLLPSVYTSKVNFHWKVKAHPTYFTYCF